MEGGMTGKMERQDSSEQLSENQGAAVIAEEPPAADTAAEESSEFKGDTVTAGENTYKPLSAEHAVDTHESEPNSSTGLQEDREDSDAATDARAVVAARAVEASAASRADAEGAQLPLKQGQTFEHNYMGAGDALQEREQTMAVATPAAAPSEHATRAVAEPVEDLAAESAAEYKLASLPSSSTQNVMPAPVPVRADGHHPQETEKQQPAPEAQAPMAVDKPKPAFAKADKPVTATSESPAVAASPKYNDAACSDPAEPQKIIKAHKETAIERLTTPTSMRMLKTLQHTQGDKTDWHIASGVVFKGKKLDADAMAAMVDRLCVAKHHEDDMPLKPQAVKLVYEGNKETYVPVKEVTKVENISYMSELYSRCQETRAKTQQQLANKYLQPLVKAKAAAKQPAAAKPGIE